MCVGAAMSISKIPLPDGRPARLGTVAAHGVGVLAEPLHESARITNWMKLEQVVGAALLGAVSCSHRSYVAVEESVTVENSRAGDPSWLDAIHQNEGLQAYANRVSASPGTSVDVMVQSNAPQSVQWTLYRLGWYAGAGARRVASGTGRVAPQPSCTTDASTQLVRCPWSPSLTVTIPSGIISGLFAIKIVRDDGNVAMVPVVVEDDRSAPLLVQASVTTWQAYNGFRGESFYQDESRTSPSRLAVAVTFDRPYNSGYGLGQLLQYEYPLVRFLERAGYDVTYTTNLDIARKGAPLLLPHRAFISGAHDEYWPLEERVAVEQARDAGVSIIFIGANEAYWKIRLSDPGADGNARVLTCYKYQQDPDQGAGTTGRWRDPPINRPEAQLAGQEYISFMFLSFPLIVADAQHFLFAGTGLSAGDVLPLVVRQEFDAPVSDSPSNLHVAARSPVVDRYGDVYVATTASYRAPSGALVFSAGSIGWTDELDGATRDPRVERMTANVIEAAAGIAVPPQVGVGDPPKPPLVIGPFARAVSTVAHGLGGAVAVAAVPDGSLVVGVKSQLLRLGPSPDRTVEPFASLAATRALATGTDGAVYAVRGNAIYVVAATAPHTTKVLAGEENQGGFADAVGTAARFDFPMGISFDTHNGVLLVADTHNSAIRAVDPVSGETSTLAVNFGVTYPTGVVRADDGRLFVSAVASGELVTVTPGATRVLTRMLPHSSDGAGDVAGLGLQGGLLWDGTQLYAADPAAGRVRRVLPGADASTTQVSTLAGGTTRGQIDGSGDIATFSLPIGLAVGVDGTIFVADPGADVIRSIQP